MKRYDGEVVIGIDKKHPNFYKLLISIAEFAPHDPMDIYNIYSEKYGATFRYILMEDLVNSISLCKCVKEYDRLTEKCDISPYTPFSILRCDMALNKILKTAKRENIKLYTKDEMLKFESNLLKENTMEK